MSAADAAMGVFAGTVFAWFLGLALWPWIVRTWRRRDRRKADYRLTVRYDPNGRGWPWHWLAVRVGSGQTGGGYTRTRFGAKRAARRTARSDARRRRHVGAEWEKEIRL